MWIVALKHVMQELMLYLKAPLNASFWLVFWGNAAWRVVLAVTNKLLLLLWWKWWPELPFGTSCYLKLINRLFCQAASQHCAIDYFSTAGRVVVFSLPNWKWCQINIQPKHVPLRPTSGGLQRRAGDFGRPHTGLGPDRLPQRYLLRLRDRGDLPGGREPVHADHRQPRHAAHLHAPGVRRHRALHHPHPHALGALSARLHPTAHQDQAQRRPRDAPQHRPPQPGQLRPQPQVTSS